LVFTPKYRRAPFTSAILERCEQITAEVCTDFGADLPEFTGETDHLHLLVHCPPKVALSRLVNSLKGVLARRLRQQFPAHIRTYPWGQHFWSPSYFAGSCGGAPLSITKDYIDNQKRPNQATPALPIGTKTGCDSSQLSTTGVPRKNRLKRRGEA
jgi:putative transposase